MDLIAYFSATGVTKKLALDLANKLNAETFEITPIKIYEKKDLNWLNPLSRSSKEMRKKVLAPNLLKKN